MAEDELYQLIDRQIYLGSETTNVYHYHNVQEDGNAEDLANTWIEEVLPVLLEVQHSGCEHVAVEVLNYQDPEDFHVAALDDNNVGTMSGEQLPRYASLGFRYNRASRDYRNGGKRIGGLAEGIQDGEVVNPLSTADVAAVADVMGQTLTGLATDALFEPVIPVSVGPGIAPAPGAISSVSFVKVTTQNSRKR